MRTMQRKSVAVSAVTALLVIGTVGMAMPAQAHNGEDHGEHDTSAVEIDLEELNDSGVKGTAKLTPTSDGDLQVWVEAWNMVPDAPHAQHIHGSTEGKDFTCPGPDADKDDDGIITTSEGVPSYGDIHISLTTKGDTSADSGLAVERMPTANSDGKLEYERTISADQLPEGTIEHLKDLHVVQHGIDTDDSGKYDGDRKSDLDQELPAEATDPAACGMVAGASAGTTPEGGMETGSTSTAGIEGMGWFVAGGLALAAAGTALTVRRRFT